MGQSARVTSIDAVQELASAIQVFRGEAVSALDDLDIEIRRALEWVHHDRKYYWDQEVRRGWERVAEARVQLHQAITARNISGSESASCYDEKKVLERANRRLDTALKKVEVVRQCARTIDQAVNEYRGCRAQLAGWLDGDVFRAVAMLNRLTEALEAYLRMGSPEAAAPSATTILGFDKTDGSDSTATATPAEVPAAEPSPPPPPVEADASAAADVGVANEPNDGGPAP
jgi:hypothetical protein